MAFETWGFMLLSELVGWETTHGSPGLGLNDVVQLVVLLHLNFPCPKY